MSDLVGNPEDRSSRVAAHLLTSYCSFLISTRGRINAKVDLVLLQYKLDTEILYLYI